MTEPTDGQPHLLSYAGSQPEGDTEDRGFRWFSYIAVGIAIVSLLLALVLMVGCVWLLIRWLA